MNSAAPRFVCLAILLAGSLSDLFGRKRVLLWGLVGFGVASVACALAPDIGLLIAARGVQGIAAALLVPSSLALIFGTFDGSEQTKAIGTWTAKFDAGQTITDQKIVMKVQAVLAKLGYDVGTPDGKAGPKTGDAIKAFELATGMNETGAVNPRLLAVLGSQPV